jgi:hypothetical protein
MTRKMARNLEGGDVILQADGTPVGVLLDDPYIYKGYQSVEFDIMYDDVKERVCCAPYEQFYVRPWRGSGAA